MRIRTSDTLVRLMALLAVLVLVISHSVASDELPCPLLNVGLECIAVSRDRALFPEDLPEGTWEVVLRTASDSQLERWFGHSGHTYWVQEPVTCEDLRLNGVRRLDPYRFTGSPNPGGLFELDV